MEIKELKKIKYDCCLKLLELYKKANAGHIGSSLSCLDILIYLFFKKMKEEDKFILSKGHSAAAFYTVLAKSKRIKEDLLNTFYQEGTYLAAHPPCNRKIKDIIFGTGSLGHGLSLGAGLALSNKFTKKKFNIYCLLSDGDCNEGSTWEAALFISHHKLKNLFVIIDNNNLQGFGKCSEILNLEPLVDKWRSFNFNVVIAENGNSFLSLENAFLELHKFNNDKPNCIIAKTTKGSGISFMENKLEWHYLSMTDEEYQKAIKELEKILDA